MAMVLKLVKREDTFSDSDALSLETWLAARGYQQSGDGHEVITLDIPGSTDDELAANVALLDKKLKEIDEADDPLERWGVWLRAKLSNETNTRQAYLLGYKRPAQIDVTHPVVNDNHMMPNYALGLSRIPCWEDESLTTIEPADNIDVNGGKVNYTIAGDKPARIAIMKFPAHTGTSVLALSEFWVGVKPPRYNLTPANFVPIWNLRKSGSAGVGGGFGADTTGGTSNADSSALDGYKVVCTFATDTTLTPRATILVIDAMASNYEDQYGNYIAVLRAKTTSSLVARVRIGYGYSNTFYFRPRQRISNTNWKYYSLGQVSLPADISPGSFSILHARLRIEAEKVSGAGNLELDSIALIPAEQLLHFSYEAGHYPSVYRRPSGKLMGVTATILNQQQSHFAPDEIDWALYQGTGTLVFLAQGSTSVKTDVVFPVMNVYERWDTLRGNA